MWKMEEKTSQQSLADEFSSLASGLSGGDSQTWAPPPPLWDPGPGQISTPDPRVLLREQGQPSAHPSRQLGGFEGRLQVQEAEQGLVGDPRSSSCCLRGRLRATQD